nr:GtrA family protein [Actibacterium sp. 188UL27-1]
MRYVVFALISTSVILGSQRLLLLIYSGWGAVELALVISTAAGLLVKYLLDKRWVFADDRTSVADHTRQFSLYALMGVFPTLILWGVQYMFWLIWATPNMLTIGGVVGLAIGYVTKYQLDKRFVFNTQSGQSVRPN